MKKRIIIALSVSNLLIWVTVMWLYIAQQNQMIYYVNNHQVSERSHIEKDTLSEKKLLTQGPEQGQGKDKKALHKEKSISIDTLLSELNIAY